MPLDAFDGLELLLHRLGLHGTDGGVFFGLMACACFLGGYTLTTIVFTRLRARPRRTSIQGRRGVEPNRAVGVAEEAGRQIS